MCGAIVSVMSVMIVMMDDQQRLMGLLNHAPTQYLIRARSINSNAPGAKWCPFLVHTATAQHGYKTVLVMLRNWQIL